MSNYPKILRSQLRNVVQDILPELLTESLVAAIEARLSKQMHAKMEFLSKNVKETMQNIDTRSKDVQGYLVRQTTNVTPVSVPEEPKQQG